LTEIGQMKGLEPILEMDSGRKAVGGWFASVWDAMHNVDWRNHFDYKAAELFLNRFTFNYHRWSSTDLGGLSCLLI